MEVEGFGGCKEKSNVQTLNILHGSGVYGVLYRIIYSSLSNQSIYTSHVIPRRGSQSRSVPQLFSDSSVSRKCRITERGYLVISYCVHSPLLK